MDFSAYASPTPAAAPADAAPAQAQQDPAAGGNDGLQGGGLFSRKKKADSPAENANSANVVKEAAAPPAPAQKQGQSNDFVADKITKELVDGERAKLDELLVTVDAAGNAAKLERVKALEARERAERERDEVDALVKRFEMGQQQ